MVVTKIPSKYSINLLLRICLILVSKQESGLFCFKGNDLTLIQSFARELISIFSQKNIDQNDIGR